MPAAPVAFDSVPFWYRVRSASPPSALGASSSIYLRIPPKLTAVSDDVDRVESCGAWGSDFSVIGQHGVRF